MRASCLWKTVEHVTGIRLDHFIQLQFTGVVKVINDLGGVDVCVPFPINEIPFVGGSHPGHAVDIGQTVPTTVMPTGEPQRTHDRAKLISFEEHGGENMCVAHNFACGLNVSSSNKTTD